MHRLAAASPRIPSYQRCLTTSLGWEVIFVTGFWKVHLVSPRGSTDLSWCLCLALAKSSCLLQFFGHYISFEPPLWKQNVKCEQNGGWNHCQSWRMFSAHLDNHTPLSLVRRISNCSVHHIYAKDWQNSDFWLSMPVVRGGDKRLHFQAFLLDGDTANTGTTHWELSPGASSRCYSKKKAPGHCPEAIPGFPLHHSTLRISSHPCHCQQYTCWSPASNITGTKKSHNSLNTKTLISFWYLLFYFPLKHTIT